MVTVDRSYTGAAYTYRALAYVALGSGPVSTAAVSLTSTGAGVNMAIPYASPITYLGVVDSYYNSSSAFTYTPGQNYVVSAAYGGQTTAVTFTAPGGNFNFHQDNDGAVTEITWGINGTGGNIQVACSAASSITYSTSFTSPSPLLISDSGVSNVYNAPGTLYSVTAQVSNYNAGNNSLIYDYYTLSPVTVLDNHWLDPYIEYNYDTISGASYGYQLNLNVQGTAPTGAGVTVTDITASHSLAIPYANGTSSGGVTYARYATNSNALSYTPGDTYVFSSTTAAAGTASVTLVAPGAVTAVDQDTTTNAITLIGWQYPGNDTANNAVSMNETSPASVPYGIANPTSPVVFTNGFYTGGTGSVYQAAVIIYSKATTVNNGLWDLGSPIEIGETYTQSFTHN